MRLLALAIASLFALAAHAQTPPEAKQGDHVIRDFKFRSGESLAELRMHYTTLGAIHRNAKGQVDNAVLIMHGTGGNGGNFFRPQFSGVLFKPGGLLDPAKYFLIMPDAIGHGKSSKPSDGLHRKFPKYDYDDMVAADYELVTKGLGVDHLRLVMGTSMGCMHSFVWGETYPDMMDALMPLACLPTEIAGRNRVWRKLLIDAIEQDPAYLNGEYKTQPWQGLRTAETLLLLAGAAPIPMQLEYGTREKADAFAKSYIETNIKAVDANDLVWQVASSRTYDPSKKLSAIKARVMWVNSADDFINPPEIGLAEGYAKQLKRGTYVLIPASKDTHGHGTHTWAALWQDRLAKLLKDTKPK